jgi:hypothetical protein
VVLLAGGYACPHCQLTFERQRAGEQVYWDDEKKVFYSVPATTDHAE